MAELGTRGTHRKGAGRKLSAYGCARRISTRRPGHGVTGGAWKRGRANGFLGEHQVEECRPVRESLPALGGGSHLPGEPCRGKGHKARRALQGIGGGEGEPHDPETGHWQSERP